MTKLLRQSLNFVGATLPWALLWLLAPVMLCAQTTEFGMGSLDDWRVTLNERLDQDLAQLNAGANSGLPTFWRVKGREGGEPVPESISFPKLAGRKSSPWLPKVAAILHEQGLPTDLVGVAAVESRFDPRALSPKGALGMWQLMPGTAKKYGLVVDGGRDERLDPLKSTLAAALYLKKLYGQFRDWPLALAAYNAGEERVQRSLDRVRTRDFWTLSRQAALPEETRRYVPAVLTEVGGSLDPLARFPSYRSVTGAQAQIVFAMTSPGPANSGRPN